ncbi:hypothetical protein ACN469_13570 [Corallococcus terminator]
MFQWQQLASIQGLHVTFTDANKDGLADALLYSPGSGTSTLYANTGDGFVAQPVGAFASLGFGYAHRPPPGPVSGGRCWTPSRCARPAMTMSPTPTAKPRPGAYRRALPARLSAHRAAWQGAFARYFDLVADTCEASDPIPWASAAGMFCSGSAGGLGKEGSCAPDAGDFEGDSRTAPTPRTTS